MREGWIRQKLGDVISLEYGKPLPPDQRRTDAGFPAYGANGIKCFAASSYCDNPSIIVGRKGTAGAVNFVEGGFWPLDVTYYVKLDSNQHDLRFLFYLLSALDLPSLATGVKPGINRNVVYAIERYFPPLPEQKRIVAILDEAFAGIATVVANTEKNLANARELFESYLNGVFSQRGEGWSVKAVGEIADHCLGKMLDKRKNKGVPRPYLRNLNVQWFEIDITDMLEMRIEDDEVERYQVKQGDLLICEGGYPGRAAIWRDSEPIFFQKALHRVRCHEPVYNRWLLYYLYLANATGALRPYFTGAGIQHFTGKALKEFRLPVAPSEEVHAIVAGMEELLEETQRLESIYQKKLTSLAELKQSLLQKAFSGELTTDKEVSNAIHNKEEVA